MAMDFVAGCIGGCAGVAVGHPFDTVKVRLQTQDFKNPVYRNGIHCLKTIIKNDSVSGLYRGMSSPMAGVAVVNAIVFGVQGNIQRRMPNPESLSSHFISGTAAGVAQSAICSPMELVKTRIQIQKQQLFKSPWGCLAHIYKTEGLRGVFRGLTITAVREGPGFGSYFLAYELLTRNEDNRPISTLHMLMAGGAAGSISWLFAYPVDVIKTRLQVDGMDGPRLYKSAIDCCAKSVKSEGISCLFRGLNITLVRAFPVNAATWAAVTWVFRLTTPHNQDNTYVKLSELKETRVFLPELNTGFQLSLSASADTTRSRMQSQYDILGRSSAPVSASSCHDEAPWLKTLLRSLSTPFFDI